MDTKKLDQVRANELVNFLYDIATEKVTDISEIQKRAIQIITDVLSDERRNLQ